MYHLIIIQRLVFFSQSRQFLRVSKHPDPGRAPFLPGAVQNRRFLPLFQIRKHIAHTEVRICVIPHLVQNDRAVQPRFHADLSAVLQETGVVQDPYRRVDQPAAFLRRHISLRNALKAAGVPKLAAQFFFCQKPFCPGFLVHGGIPDPGQMPELFRPVKFFNICILYRNHHIPLGRRSVKIRNLRTEAADGKEAEHKPKRQEGKGQ